MVNDKISSAYPEAALLVGAAQSVWEGSAATVTITIGISQALITKLNEFLNCHIEQVFITDSDIRHILKTHGKNESDRGQIDIAPNDFASLPLILNEFDEIVLGKQDKLGNKRLLITKDIGDIAFVATVTRGNRKLEVKTFWKKRVPGASC